MLYHCLHDKLMNQFAEALQMKKAHPFVGLPGTYYSYMEPQG